MVTQVKLARRIMLRRQRIALAMLGAAFTIGTTGCANSASSSTIADDGAAASSEMPTVIQPAPVSPIDEYLNLVWGTNLSPEAQIQRHAAESQRIEELVAQCMNDLGFQYIPDPGRRWLDFSSGVEWRTDDPEWVAQHGFGGTVWPGPIAGRGEQWEGDRPGQPGPNAAFINSLSETERTAFNRALNGRLPTDDTDYDWDEWWTNHSADFDWDEWQANPNNQGCRDFAWQQTVFYFQQSDEFAPLFEAIDRFRENLTLSATEADIDWAACMVDAGFTGYQSRPDFRELFHQEAGAITTELQEQGRPISRWPELPANQPEIAALFEREVETALADLDCRIATNYDARQQAAIFESEAQFVADHQSQFNALRAAAEQRG